jgi:hypothetical protein
MCLMRHTLQHILKTWFESILRHVDLFSWKFENYYIFSGILITKAIMGDPDGKIYPSLVDYI